MSLEHLAVSESEKILQKKKKKVGRTSKGHKNQPDKAPNGQRENNLSNKRKKKTEYWT